MNLYQITVIDEDREENVFIIEDTSLSKAVLKLQIQNEEVYARNIVSAVKLNAELFKGD
jgi:hypothetical protein